MKRYSEFWKTSPDALQTEVNEAADRKEADKTMPNNEVKAKFDTAKAELKTSKSRSNG